MFASFHIVYVVGEEMPEKPATCKRLAKEEEEVIVHMGTEAPFTGNAMIFGNVARLCADGVVRRFTVLKTSLKPVVDGPVLMLRF